MGSLAKSEIEPLPRRGCRERRWINCPILFRSARSAITDKLRRELGAFLRYPRLLSDVPKTALAPFLGGMAKATGRPMPIVEVVPLNPEQTQAATEALSRPLTVITGPPGTGKSQVVIDLLASCAAAGRPVLFCSRNNKAVDVVRERIRELLGKEHDWTLRLGNRHHMEATKEEMTQRIDTWEGPQPSPRTPDFDEWDHQVELAYRQRQQISQMQDQLNEAVERLRDLAGCLPDSWISMTPSEFRERLPLDRVTALRDRAARLSGQGSIGLWLRLVRWLFPRRLLNQLQESLVELLRHVPAPIASEAMHTAEGERGFRSLAEAFARLLGYARWLGARDQVDDLQSRLARLPTTPRLSQEISDAKRARSEAAARWLRDAWTARVTGSQAEVRELLASFFGANDRLYAAAGREFVRRLEEFASVIRGLGEHLPVWIVTNLSVRRSLPLKPALFDLVIIDEASQCDIASALPLLYRARRAVIIGDPHQLRHITVLREPEEVELARQCSAGDLLDDWSYVRHSVYDLAARATRRADHEPIFLREHFRSWPLIAEFSNRRIYQSRLRLRTDLQRLRRRLDGRELGIVWHPVRGNVPATQRSAWNPAEVQAIRRLLQDWWDSGFLGRPDLRFGIVTPFRLQVDHIGELLRQQSWWPELDGRLLVGTAHQFQGDECDVMIFSPVVSAGMRTRTRDWLTHTEHLLNVAITRARAVLHVVGDRHACVDAGGLLGEFGEEVKDRA